MASMARLQHITASSTTGGSGAAPGMGRKETAVVEHGDAEQERVPVSSATQRNASDSAAVPAAFGHEQPLGHGGVPLRRQRHRAVRAVYSTYIHHLEGSS